MRLKLISSNYLKTELLYELLNELAVDYRTNLFGLLQLLAGTVMF